MIDTIYKKHIDIKENVCKMVENGEKWGGMECGRPLSLK
jgi:hypothetical protein